MTVVETPIPPPSPRDDGDCEHIVNGMIEDDTLREVAHLVHRKTGRGTVAAKALALWAHEIVVWRSPHGAICGAHGFAFAEVADSGRRYRLVYTVFSAIDERFASPAVQMTNTRARLYESLRAQPETVIWATPSRFREQVPEDTRRFEPASESTLPRSICFWMHVPPQPDDPSELPSAVADELSRLVEEQSEAETDALSGRRVTVPLWRRFGAGVGAAALMGAAAFAIVGHRPSTEEEAIATRTKGGAALHVHRQTATGAEEMISQGVFRPGDRLTLTADLPAESNVALVGVESSGRLYSAEEPRHLPAGPGQPLGAVQLDDSTGIETLYLVTCRPASVEPICSSTGPSSPPSCPTGCTAVPFVLDKSAATDRPGP